MHLDPSIVGGIIGGAVSLLFFPLFSYLLVRIINTLFTSIKIETPLENQVDHYFTLSLRINNRTLSTLKNVVAFISITFSKENIASDPNIQIYTVDSTKQPLMLSWAKVIDGGNKPGMDINQGESADLNLFRHHLDHRPLPSLQIASEAGFSDIKNKKSGRVLLKLDQDYVFRIKITADNMFPITEKYAFNQVESRIEPFDYLAGNIFS